VVEAIKTVTTVFMAGTRGKAFPLKMYSCDEAKEKLPIHIRVLRIT